MEPPVAITSAIAFSIDFRVMMSRGFKSRLIASHQHPRRLGRGVRLFVVGRGHLRAPEEADAQRLERRRHRVRRVHAAAGADTRAGVPLDAVVILLRHLAGGKRADGLERRDDGQRLALPLARLDRARIDEDARNIHPRHRHHARRHVLVATADDQHAIHALAVDRRLDRVGDHFARHERVLHALGAHADAVGDRRARRTPAASRRPPSAPSSRDRRAAGCRRCRDSSCCGHSRRRRSACRNRRRRIRRRAASRDWASGRRPAVISLERRLYDMGELPVGVGASAGVRARGRAQGQSAGCV